MIKNLSHNCMYPSNDVSKWQPCCQFVPQYIFEDLSVMNGETLPSSGGFAAIADEENFDPIIDIKTTPQSLRNVRINAAAQPRLAIIPNPQHFGAIAPNQHTPEFPIYDLDGATDFPNNIGVPEYKLKIQSGIPLPTNQINDWPSNAKSALDTAQNVYNFYKNCFQRNSIDNGGMDIISSVRLRTYVINYDRNTGQRSIALDQSGQPIKIGENNAFWDGSIMAYGEGDNIVFTDFTASEDVIGHELTHGVTEHTCQLAYKDQSGALNEHISDVFGIIFRQYQNDMKDPSTAHWLIGDGCIKEDFKKMVKVKKFGHWDALRSMSQPGNAYNVTRGGTTGKDRQPNHMNNYQNISYDNGGVHINSGIPNKAFYEFAISLNTPSWDMPGRIWYNTIVNAQFGQIDGNGERIATFKQFRDATVSTAHQIAPGVESLLVDAWVKVGL